MNLEQDEKLILFDQGMIEAWKHIQNICKMCITAHKEEIKRRKMAEAVKKSKR